MIFTFDLYGTLVDWNTSIGNFLNLIRRGLREDFFKEEFKIVKNIKNFIPYSSILKETIKNVPLFQPKKSNIIEVHHGEQWHVFNIHFNSRFYYKSYMYLRF